MATKKDYEAIAAILARYDDDSEGRISAIADELAEYFGSDNPRFDRDRFLAACCYRDN